MITVDLLRKSYFLTNDSKLKLIILISVDVKLKKTKKTKRAWVVLGETEKSLWSDERNINLYQNAGKSMGENVRTIPVSIAQYLSELEKTSRC